MNIILEGPDASGKSTLATRLSDRFTDMMIRPSPGKPRDRFEAPTRAMIELQQDKMIFDRHTALSECVYGQFRPEGNTMPWSITNTLLYHPAVRRRHIIVWCVGETDLSNHEIKDHDDLDHIDMVNANHAAIVSAYRNLLKDRADVQYRIRRDDPNVIIELIDMLMNLPGSV